MRGQGFGASGLVRAGCSAGLGVGCPFLGGSDFGWPFPGGADFDGSCFLGGCLAQTGCLARTLRMIFPVLDLEAFNFTNHLCGLFVLVGVLGEILLPKALHEILWGPLAVDLDPVESDDQDSVAQRRLQVGFTVQIAPLNTGRGRLQFIERKADPSLEFIALNFGVDCSFKLRVFFDQPRSGRRCSR